MECNFGKALCEMIHAKIIKSQVIDFSPTVSRFHESFQWNRSGAITTRSNQIIYIFAVIIMVKLVNQKNYLSVNIENTKHSHVLNQVIFNPMESRNS